LQTDNLSKENLSVNKVTTEYETRTLKVPGASLYYEVRGSGPVLLTMPGGPADAASFHPLAGYLASNYTVVTYDPRGLSHSRLEGELQGDRIVEIFADDAHRLLAAVTKEKANVFASSGGAVIALELAARHPEEIKTLVAHEAPAQVLLPDTARRRAEVNDIVETYRSAGIGPTMQKFMAHTGIRGGPPVPQGEPTPEMLEAMANMQRNMGFWFGSGYFGSIAAYEPDFNTLKNCSCRIVSAVGEESRGELAHQGGLGLAKRLVSQPVVFPGAHGGHGSHAEEFAAKLREVLEA
jgi:pimeloyl-ACP methyl ester carboxylesterase